MATAVLTGGTGQIGPAVARALLGHGWRVVCPVRQLPPASAGTEVTWLPTRLDDPDQLGRDVAPFAPEALVHLAGSGVRPGDRDPAALVAGNVRLTAAVLGAARAWPVRRIVCTGSVAELGDPGPEPADESALVRPVSDYGTAKAAATVLALGLGRTWNLPVVVLRLFGVFGPGERPERLVPHLCRCLLSAQPAPLTSGEQVRDWTYEDDVAQAFALALAADLPAGALYHICGGAGRSVRAMATRLAALLGANPDLLQWGALPQRSDEPKVLVGNPGRFAAATGWQPQAGLDEGLLRTAAHVRRQLGAV